MKRKVASPDIQVKKRQQAEAKLRKKELKEELKEEMTAYPKKIPKTQPRRGHK